MPPTLAATLGAPLRGIEATAKLLAAGAIEDHAAAGAVLLECVAEIRAQLHHESRAAVVDSVEVTRRNWSTEERNAAVNDALGALGTWATPAEIVQFVKFPAHVNQPKRMKRAVRAALEDLLAHDALERRKVGKQGPFDQWEYRAVVATRGAA